MFRSCLKLIVNPPAMIFVIHCDIDDVFICDMSLYHTQSVLSMGQFKVRKRGLQGILKLKRNGDDQSESVGSHYNPKQLWERISRCLDDDFDDASDNPISENQYISQSLLRNVTRASRRKFKDVNEKSFVCITRIECKHSVVNKLLGTLALITWRQ